MSLAESTSHETRQRDTDLTGSDIVVELAVVLENREESPGLGTTALGGFLDTRATRPDSRELGCDVQGVEAHHHKDEENYDD